MADLHSLIEQHKNLSEEAQKHAGQAIAGTMQPQHYEFLELLKKLRSSGEINSQNPTSFLNPDQYQKLSEEDRSKVDAALVNIADQFRHIEDFYFSKETPNESPHLETMIEHLFHMKNRVEEKYGDVLKF
jgi:hypothetical protein